MPQFHATNYFLAVLLSLHYFLPRLPWVHQWIPSRTKNYSKNLSDSLYCHVTNISANEEQNGICSIAWIIEVDSLRNLWRKNSSTFPMHNVLIYSQLPPPPLRILISQHTRSHVTLWLGSWHNEVCDSQECTRRHVWLPNSTSRGERRKSESWISS